MTLRARPNEVAVVTGAARGLGLAIAARLARAGYRVAVTDLDGAGAARAASELGGGAWAEAQDVRDPDSHRRIAAAAQARGPLAVWVNNAGVLTTGEAWALSDEAVRREVEVDLLGVIWGCRAAVGALVDDGRILNVASLSSLVPAPGLATYAATKHAVLGYSLSLAGELRRAGRRIAVGALCPDVIATDMVRAVSGDAAAGLLFAKAPLGVDEVADAALAQLAGGELLRTVPRALGALAHATRPFPALVLPVLEGLFRRGGRRGAR